MSISVSNLCWFYDDVEAFKILHNNRIKKIEISPIKQFGNWNTFGDDKIINFKHEIKNHFDLNVASLQSIFYQKKINIFDQQQEFIDHFKRIIDISAILGCPYIVYGSPKTKNTNNRTFAECEEIFINIFDKISQHNDEIVIGIETNPRYYNNQFINTYFECDEILKKLNKKNVVFHFDLACIYLEGDNPVDIYKQEKDNIKHLHVSSKDLKTIRDSNLDLFFDNIDINNKITYSIEMLNQQKDTLELCIKDLKRKMLYE